MSITTSLNGDELTIHTDVRFDFNELDNFKSAYESNKVKKYTVNFTGTSYIDSSGLGMLINMKKDIGSNPIDLINCNQQIKKVLVLSRFDEQFNIV